MNVGNSLRFPPILVFASILSVVLAGAAKLRASDKASLYAARDSASVARLSLENASARAARSDSVAAVAATMARAAESRELRAVAKADSTAKSANAQRARYRVASVLAPDTCRVVVASADSALAAADSVAATLRVALGAAGDRATFLQLGLDTARAALLDLRVAAQRSAAATAVLEKRVTPGWRTRLASIAPRVGVGAAAGLDRTGQLNALTGLTLSWVF